MSFAYRDRGYQDFSKLMASSDDFFVIRRFQSLNAHVILYMQYRIAQIEERLQEIHEECKKGNPSEANNGSFRWDLICEPERDSLMCELTSLLHHYNQYIDTFTRIRQRPNAAKYQVQNVEEYFKEKTITEKERNFIIHKHDLVSINPTVSSPLGRLLEWSDVVVRLLRAKKDENSQVVDLVDYGSDTALANLTTGSIIALGCIMLLGPMWGLEFVTNSHKRLGIITGFLVGFMAFMACASVHKPFEVVAASAAYAAVLMVFMQIEAK
ncbi:hypothetical protein P154DRAFT_437197 [Amniculicola lignicola CBS 123094]|uniref:DUF6594 domain-containing protein n=1 Tax=Amniculicola lignicola CBS 123094 TaxID=1392246 RepID=A0A6A5WF85_9PLEO|nr:hypothetical protein P154DRAFT_437197 [Amniculicola lignicola CBS 123094]